MSDQPERETRQSRLSKIKAVFERARNGRRASAEGRTGLSVTPADDGEYDEGSIVRRSGMADRCRSEWKLSSNTRTRPAMR